MSAYIEKSNSLSESQPPVSSIQELEGKNEIARTNHPQHPSNHHVITGQEEQHDTDEVEDDEADEDDSFLLSDSPLHRVTLRAFHDSFLEMEDLSSQNTVEDKRGRILARTSALSLLTASWEEQWWIISRGRLLLFGTEETRDQLNKWAVKNVANITPNLRLLPIKSKSYSGTGQLFNFMLEEITENGVYHVGKFASANKSELEYFVSAVRDEINEVKLEKTKRISTNGIHYEGEIPPTSLARNTSKSHVPIGNNLILIEENNGVFGSASGHGSSSHHGGSSRGLDSPSINQQRSRLIGDEVSSPLASPTTHDNDVTSNSTSHAIIDQTSTPKGKVLTRISTVSLMTGVWEEKWWSLYPGHLLLYTSELARDKGLRRAVSYKITFNPNHRLYPIKVKEYSTKGLLHNFMLEEITENGVVHVGKFGSPDKESIEHLHQIIRDEIDEAKLEKTKRFAVVSRESSAHGAGTGTGVSGASYNGRNQL